MRIALLFSVLLLLLAVPAQTRTLSRVAGVQPPTVLLIDQSGVNLLIDQSGVNLLIALP